MRTLLFAFALDAVALATVLGVPSVAATRPAQPLLTNPLAEPVVQRLMHPNKQNGPTAANLYRLPLEKLHAPRLKPGPGPKPKNGHINQLYLDTELGGSVQFYNLAGGLGVKPWIQLTAGGITYGNTVDPQHNLYFTDAPGLLVIVPWPFRLQTIQLIDCFCDSFDVKLDEQGTIYLSHLDGLFGQCICDTVFVYAQRGTHGLTNTLYDPNLADTEYMAVDSQGDLIVTGHNRALTAVIMDVFPAGSSKPKRLKQFSDSSELTVAFDKHDNLLVGAFSTGAISTYAPPWTHPAIASIGSGSLYNNGMVMSNDRPQNIWISPAFYYSEAEEFTQSGSLVDYTAVGYPYLPIGVAIDPPAPT